MRYLFILVVILFVPSYAYPVDVHSTRTIESSKSLSRIVSYSGLGVLFASDYINNFLELVKNSSGFSLTIEDFKLSIDGQCRAESIARVRAALRRFYWFIKDHEQAGDKTVELTYVILYDDLRIERSIFIKNNQIKVKTLVYGIKSVQGRLQWAEFEVVCDLYKDGTIFTLNSSASVNSGLNSKKVNSRIGLINRKIQSIVCVEINRILREIEDEGRDLVEKGNQVLLSLPGKFISKVKNGIRGG